MPKFFKGEFFWFFIVPLVLFGAEAYIMIDVLKLSQKTLNDRVFILMIQFISIVVWLAAMVMIHDKFFANKEED